MTIGKSTFMVLAALGLPLAARAQLVPHAAPAARNIAQATAQQETLNPDVATAQEQIRRVTAGYRAGANTSADISVAQIVLAEARLRSAVQSSPEGVLQNLEAIVAQRMELVRIANAQFHAGVGSFADVRKAYAALEEAQTRVFLYKAITLQNGAPLKQAVDKAAAALKDAQSQSAEAP